MGQPKRTERGFNPQGCPYTAAMSVIGAKWAGAVWYRLSRGPMRSAELRRTLPGISQKMLVEQLRQFEVEGLVERRVADTVPPQVEYALTEHGWTLEPALGAIAKWGAGHMDRMGRSKIADPGVADSSGGPMPIDQGLRSSVA